MFHLYFMIDDPGPGVSETSRDFFVVLNKFWIILIPSLSQDYYYKKTGLFNKLSVLKRTTSCEHLGADTTPFVAVWEADIAINS